MGLGDGVARARLLVEGGQDERDAPVARAIHDVRAGAGGDLRARKGRTTGTGRQGEAKLPAPGARNPEDGEDASGGVSAVLRVSRAAGTVQSPLITCPPKRSRNAALPLAPT